MNKRQSIWLQPGIIGRFVTWSKAWQLATKTLKSSKNSCALDPWWDQRMTWVWKYNKESRLQIGLTKSTIHKTLIRSEPKVRRTNCSYLRGNAVYRRRYNHELVKEFDSPNALNVTKTSRLRYTGHMIRRPEDLPQKTLFRAKPNGKIYQGRPKSRWADGVNSDSLALGVRNWMHCAQDRQSWKDLLDQVLTRYWL
jgi:hypothetical protein